MQASQSFTGPHVRDIPGLSGPSSEFPATKQNRPNRPHEHDRLVDRFSIL